MGTENKLTITGSNFTNNNAKVSGGAVLINHGNAPGSGRGNYAVADTLATPEVRTVSVMNNNTFSGNQIAGVVPATTEPANIANIVFGRYYIDAYLGSKTEKPISGNTAHADLTYTDLLRTTYTVTP
jgi:hypothetical protein